MYIDTNRELVFIHIPRTGGSSVKNALGIGEPFYKNGWHLSYSNIPTEFDNFFSFAFVRNPWDRFVSIYEYQRSKNYKGSEFHKQISELPFNEWIYLFQYKDIQQLDYVGIKKLDFIGKFSNLKKHMKNIFDVDVLHENKSDRLDYREYYDEKTKDFVFKIAKDDIEYFKFEF